VLETRGVSLAMTALLLDCTILLVHQLMVHASMLLRAEDQVVLRFDDGNAVKFVEGRRLEIVFLLLFLSHRMEQDLLLGKEVRQERSRVVALAHRALERILGLFQPLLETLAVDRHTSLAAAAASLHQLAFFF